MPSTPPDPRGRAGQRAVQDFASALVGGRAGSRQGHETPRIARRMLTGLARHWRDPTARWAPCYPCPHAVVQDTVTGMHATVGGVVVVMLSFDIGEPTGR